MNTIYRTLLDIRSKSYTMVFKIDYNVRDYGDLKRYSTMHKKFDRISRPSYIVANRDLFKRQSCSSYNTIEKGKFILIATPNLLKSNSIQFISLESESTYNKYNQCNEDYKYDQN